jgi:hypothetical protein
MLDWSVQELLIFTPRRPKEQKLDLRKACVIRLSSK